MSRELVAFDNALPVGSLDNYIYWANQVPLLTEEEEYDLATRLREHNDLEAARRLVMSHLRFVIKMARGYLGYGLQLGDLIQEGSIGLMKAVKRFDPKVGVRLVSFAIHWIRSEIHEFVIKNWRIVKIATTKAQRKLFFNIRKMAKERSWFSESEIKMVAEELNVREKDVRQMEMRLHSYDQAFDGYDDDSDERASLTWAAPVNYLEDRRNSPERSLVQEDWNDQRSEHLQTALTQLDERSRDILQQRWLNEDSKQTLHELAAKYEVSAERIRQLEKNAMAKMRASIEDHLQ